MSEMQKWNYEKDDYEPYTVPDDWKVMTIAEADSDKCNCASCGKELPFGKTFTSRVIHTRYGMGYGVCKKCYDKELEDDLEYHGIKRFGEGK